MRVVQGIVVTGVALIPDPSDFPAMSEARIFNLGFIYNNFI